jgi:hypothetical protein
MNGYIVFGEKRQQWIDFVWDRCCPWSKDGMTRLLPKNFVHEFDFARIVCDPFGNRSVILETINQDTGERFNINITVEQLFENSHQSHLKPTNVVRTLNDDVTEMAYVFCESHN